MNELSTKNFVLVLTDGTRFFLDEKESEMAKEALKVGSKWIEIGEAMINTFNVSRIVSGGDYAELEKAKRGEWKCSCGNWIPKGMRCGFCN